jgi:hypothetical protein
LKVEEGGKDKITQRRRGSQRKRREEKRREEKRRETQDPGRKSTLGHPERKSVQLSVFSIKLRRGGPKRQAPACCGLGATRASELFGGWIRTLGGEKN